MMMMIVTSCSLSLDFILRDLVRISISNYFEFPLLFNFNYSNFHFLSFLFSIFYIVLSQLENINFSLITRKNFIIHKNALLSELFHLFQLFFIIIKMVSSSTLVQSSFSTEKSPSFLSRTLKFNQKIVEVHQLNFNFTWNFLFFRCSLFVL